ncbi:hypothetical protein E2C01_049491 [Portunus trituberculatus]|uniref:Uncharacterized protein n=1 Tax=Portunus trituberculatus TaxID=210409 RepID=A0A5B7G6I6_PORTR|nr:hypothetical protein [Portunus trituberculatus]
MPPRPSLIEPRFSQVSGMVVVVVVVVVVAVFCQSADSTSGGKQHLVMIQMHQCSGGWESPVFSIMFVKGVIKPVDTSVPVTANRAPLCLSLSMSWLRRHRF